MSRHQNKRGRQLAAASLHRLKPTDTNQAAPNLHRSSVGEHFRRLFCLIIVRAPQGVLIENVAFGREDKYPVFLHRTPTASHRRRRRPPEPTGSGTPVIQKRALSRPCHPWTAP